MTDPAARVFAYRVLDPITPSSESVVLQIQELEARVDVFDELADLKRAAEITHRHRVRRKSSLIFRIRSGSAPELSMLFENRNGE